MKLNSRFLHIAAVIALPVFAVFSACAFPGDTSPPDSAYVSGIPTPTPSFETFTTDIFCEEVSADTISLHYFLAQPEHYGISDVPITLGSIDDAISPDESAITLYEQLIPYYKEGLTYEEQLTYDTLERHLTLLMEDTFSPYLSEFLGPVTGFQAQLPILLAEYRFDDTEDVEEYLALLPQVYAYFEEIASFERKKSDKGYFMDDTTAEEIIAQCKDFISNPDDNFLISTFADRISALDLPLSQETDYILLNKSALFSSVYPAYELLTDTLTDCLGSGENPYGMSYYDGGKDYYALLVKLLTGSDKTVPELKQMLTDAIDTACLTLATLLASDATLYDAAMQPGFPVSDPNEIIQYVVLRSEQDFPLIDCGNFEIKYIPEALQDHVSPAMYLTPPIDRYEPNVIYINPNPIYDQESLFPTVVHESYPGHMYQAVSALSNDINPLRYLLAPTGYEEGFATYVEYYCYKYAGFSDALTSFLQADMTASLCLYALSDICIHYDGYTPEQLSAQLAVYGFPQATSDIIYQTLLSEPGSYLPYAVGFLEFLELRDIAKEHWGDNYSDYRFHEFLVETGPLPFSFLQTELKNRP